MTSEREQSHAHVNQDVSIDRDEAGVGRVSRSAQLDSPASPVVTGLVSRKAERDANGVAAGAEQAVASAQGSSGASLPDTLMRKFEQSLGTDLSSVRVHTGAASEEASQAVGAKAYAMGQDIHFGAGQFDPSSSSGQHLIAHEVAHTVQQRGGSPIRQNKLAVSSPHDAAEHEADAAASAMVAGQGFSIGSFASAGAPAQVGGFTGGVHRSPKETKVDAQVPAPYNYEAVTTAASVEAINAPWTGKPAYASPPTKGDPTDLDFAKDLFNAIWSTVQRDWNAIVPLAQRFTKAQAEAEATGVADFGNQPGNIDKSGDDARMATHTKVSEAFDANGAVLKQGATSFDGAKVSKEVKEQVANTKTEIKAADGTLTQCSNNIGSAQAQLRIAVSVFYVKSANKDKILTQKGIDAQAKMAEALQQSANIFGKGLDGAGKVVGGGTGSDKFEGAVLSGALSVAGMVNTLYWDSELRQIDGEVSRLKGQLDSIDRWNADREIAQAFDNIEIAKNAIKNALITYKQTIALRAQKYRALGSLLEKAGSQSGLNAKDAEKVSLAVQAKPMIELVVASSKDLNNALAGTDFENLKASIPAQQGCALADNRLEFSARYAILKNAKPRMGTVAAKWAARLVSADKAVNDAH